MELNGKAALVLGGIKGIGKAVALGLAESGASVAATYFDWEEELPALERDLSRAARDHLCSERTCGRWTNPVHGR